MAEWSTTMDEKNHIMAAEFEEMETGGRPLIRGKVMPKNHYKNSLSSRQMDSLTSLCDTFLPCLSISGDKDGSKKTFYRTSASMAGTPQRLGGLLSERLKHPKLFMARLALWALSTGIGTLILCGIPSLSPKFPFLQKFSQISPQKREQIVTAWSRSILFPLRLLFTALKVLILLVFFTQVDENEENPSWKAIGYCGPDPDFKRKTQRIKTFKQMLDSPNQDENQEEKCLDQLFGPLYKGVVYLDRPKQFVFERLQEAGFSVNPNASRSNSIRNAFEIKCDAVIVGSGSGGGVVAGILANAGYKVLVLEKGSYSARTNLSLLEGSTMDQMYLGNGLLATTKMEVQFLAGSTVGGGSTVNWSASIRTPPHVLKEWSTSYELELFDSKLYREALDAVCEKMGVQSEINDEGFNNMVLRKGCQELGYPVNTIPRNAPADHYCGWCCLGCKDGRKKGTPETWLLDLVQSGNGAILPECEVVEVLHKRKNNKGRKKAIGVKFRFRNHQGAEELCFVKSKVTIVACGALSTPNLLKQSGLKNPNIGKNLHIHPVAMAWGYFPDNKTVPDQWPETEKRSYEGGIMTAMSTVVANFERSGYGAVIQTPALHPGMFSALIPWVSGRNIKDRMCKFARTAHIFALARDIGSGEIVSPHEITYNMDRIDEQNIKAGLEKVLRILAHAGAEEIGTHHVGGKSINVKKVSYGEFDKFVKEESARPLKDLETPICSAHQMGSCRMGVDPECSAVNPMGETWEIEGLYVADTSVFPTALGVNPMVTVQAIAYCTAQSVLETLKRRREKWQRNSSIFSGWESEV
ncbi:OLC1v1030791C1 [Oldenlandia corymbosa var. corymbosa]|uniref:long-chain-alcohol oxidase n=1 Tax=Oldenlandia corymbosa var. corymbosa TaxID=529605 RepID=A0AAV1CIN7_OLDCO|nr:OLC1v1030791C1 [Oldenlandia corymbosa var. corymbosa]